MHIGEICKIDVPTVAKGTSVREAAQLMEENCVGNVVVVEDCENKSNPCGILTDRDIVLNVVAKDKDLEMSVEEVMSKDLLIIKKEFGLQETIEKLQEKAVRRAPIIDENNKVIGMATLDDILPLLAKEMYCVAELITSQLQQPDKH